MQKNEPKSNLTKYEIRAIWLLPKESRQHWMPCFERISGETQSRFEWHLKCSDLPKIS